MANVPEIDEFRVLQYDERDSHDRWEDLHDYSELLWKSKYINYVLLYTYIMYIRDGKCWKKKMWTEKKWNLKKWMN